MKIAFGYKCTSLGVFPDSWTVRRLEELADPKVHWSFTGGPFGSNLKSSDYTEYGVRIIQLQNIGDGIFKNAYEVYTSHAKADELRSCNIFPGEIILSKMGDPVARACIVPSQDKRYLMCSDGIRLAINENNFHPYFILSQINASNFRNRASSASTGSTRKRIGLSELRLLELICPPIGEQNEIARVLSDIDELLTTLNQFIVKKRDIKKAAMQQLLTGKTRLPGFEGAWVGKRLDEIVMAQKGQLITSNTLLPGTIPVIAGGKQPAYFHAYANRFGKTITISASGASAGYVAFHDTPIFASDCSTIGESNSYCIEFLYYSLLLKQDAIYDLQTGGAQPHINPKDIAPLIIQISTDVAEQKAIAGILSDMDEELLKIEERRTKTKELKQAMMQELLTGKTRLIAKEHQ